MSDASASSRGSAVSRPGLVGEQHQQVGADEVGDERGQAVVVAEADLVVGDGVVLVDDGHDAELEQPGQRRPGVQVLLADHEVERGEQHLAADEPALGQGRRRTPASGGSGPTADAACSVTASRGRTADSPSAGRPAAMAPLVTITTRWPARRSAHHLGAELADGGVVDLAAVGR